MKRHLKRNEGIKKQASKGKSGPPQMGLEAAFGAVKNLFGSVVGFALRNGVRLRELTEILKIAACEYALHELRSGDEVNFSKLSLYTGVHRKDVQRILSGRIRESGSSDILTRVIGAWQHDKRFSSSKGIPRSLTCRGDSSEFAELVRSVSREVTIYPIIAELLRTKFVEREGDNLKLLVKEYLPIGNIEESFQMVGQDLTDLIAGAEENVLNDLGITNAHYTTQFDNIPGEELVEIREKLNQLALEMHDRVRKLLSHYDRDIENGSSSGDYQLENNRYRVAFGTFSNVEAFESYEKRRKINVKSEV